MISASEGTQRKRDQKLEKKEGILRLPVNQKNKQSAKFLTPSPKKPDQCQRSQNQPSTGMNTQEQTTIAQAGLPKADVLPCEQQDDYARVVRPKGSFTVRNS